MTAEISTSTRLIACPDCAALQALGDISSGRQDCWRCRAPLERASGRSLNAALACTLATFFFLFPANLLPLLHFNYAGISGQTRISAGVALLWSEGFVLVAIVIALQVMVLPFFRFGILAAALTAVRSGVEGKWVGPAFRWAEKLDLWAMPDVFLIGCAIGYSRIAPYAPVTIGGGGWCIIGAAFMAMMTRASLDRRLVWRRIKAPTPAGDRALACTVCDYLADSSDEGARCPRCGEPMWRRKPFAFTYAAALTAAGFILYAPAYLFPMSRFDSALIHTSHTIFTGVQDLVDAGLWPLACLIFTASIAIPFLKLAGMTWFLISIKQGSDKRLVLKTQLYRFIDEIGRWSNMDVYTIAVFTPMVQFGQIASFRSGIGTPFFLGVVVVTMFASQLFDPRLMWDAAGVTG